MPVLSLSRCAKKNEKQDKFPRQQFVTHHVVCLGLTDDAKRTTREQGRATAVMMALVDIDQQMIIFAGQEQSGTAKRLIVLLARLPSTLLDHSWCRVLFCMDVWMDGGGGPTGAGAGGRWQTGRHGEGCQRRQQDEIRGSEEKESKGSELPYPWMQAAAPAHVAGRGARLGRFGNSAHHRDLNCVRRCSAEWCAERWPNSKPSGVVMKLQQGAGRRGGPRRYD